MFQDYCEAHGRPVVENSLYCCEECRMQDEVNSMPQSPLESYQEEEPFLYECLFCSHPHGPSSPCNAAYSYTNEPEPLSISENLSFVPKSYDITQSSPNEHLLLANYQKWLSTVRN
ncbi:hypothetical protein JA9_000629 [Meyerozyma sp. JA9]|nr:hypothetical protein JA9_000629 [Meyerozyma sp. JA9]